MFNCKVHFFINGNPQKTVCYFEKGKKYYPTFCFNDGTVELTNNHPKELPKDLFYLLEFKEENYQSFPKYFQNVIFLLLLFRKRFNSQSLIGPLPKPIIYLIINLFIKMN